MQEAIKKSEVLIEALPYIRAFREKIIVIKYGGSAIVDRKKRRSILEDIVFMSFAGMRPVIVHGGGPYINERMKKLKRKPKFVMGLRVTTDQDIHIIKDVLSRVNRHIVKEIKYLGGRAQSVLSRNCVIGVKRHSRFGDIGLVGDIVSVDATTLKYILSKGLIPVVWPLGVGRDKKIYNVNADQASAAVAAALSAEKLAFLTNVGGILKDVNNENSLIHTLMIKQLKSLMNRKIVASGMIPKAKACISALNGGVKKVHIINANLPHALLLEIFTDKGIGTEITR